MLDLFSKWQKRDLIFFSFGLLCLTPIISSPVALLLGFTLVTLGLIPAQIDINLVTKKLLSYSIIGLGFGINLDQAIAASKGGIGLIITSIFSTLILGWVLTKILKIDQKTGHLIASGTAICGGSAIAAVAPAINAKGEVPQSNASRGTADLEVTVYTWYEPTVRTWQIPSVREAGDASFPVFPSGNRGPDPL